MARRSTAQDQAEIHVEPCISCGASMGPWLVKDVLAISSGGNQTICKECGLHGPRADTPLLSIEKWNELYQIRKTADAYNAISGASNIYEFALWIGEIQKKIKMLDTALIGQDMRKKAIEFARGLAEISDAANAYANQFNKLSKWNKTTVKGKFEKG